MESESGACEWSGSITCLASYSPSIREPEALTSERLGSRLKWRPGEPEAGALNGQSRLLRVRRRCLMQIQLSLIANR